MRHENGSLGRGRRLVPKWRECKTQKSVAVFVPLNGIIVKDCDPHSLPHLLLSHSVNAESAQNSCNHSRTRPSTRIPMVTNTANVNCTATTMHFCTFHTVKGKGITLERNEQKRHKNKVAAYSTKSEKKK